MKAPNVTDNSKKVYMLLLIACRDCTNEYPFNRIDNPDNIPLNKDELLLLVKRSTRQIKHDWNIGAIGNELRDTLLRANEKAKNTIMYCFKEVNL